MVTNLWPDRYDLNVLKLPLSDHDLIQTKVKVYRCVGKPNKLKTSQEPMKGRIFPESRMIDFGASLENVDWHSELKGLDTEAKFNKFFPIFTYWLDVYFPIKTYRSKVKI